MISLVPASLPLDVSSLRPGLRLAVGLSGGADSVALLCALAEKSRELGLVLHAAHLHHGLRGEEADADLEFARALAQKLDVPFHHARVDTAAEVKAHGESIEEAARRLRYAWFQQLMSQCPPQAVVDAVATAHTLDDQAETVLAKFLRGAWTEGLSGIHPVLEFPKGKIIRPFLAARRAEIECWLRERNQHWREDSSNRHLTFTRNRIRHELLPQLEAWNPRLREHLAQMAELARDEEAAWETELERLALQLILPGSPVRGGGRAASQDLAIDVIRLAELAPALQRRLLRQAAGQCGISIDFPATESLRQLALTGRASQKLELAGGLHVERTHRELRFTVQPPGSSPANSTKVAAEIPVPIPGEVEVRALGIRLHVELANNPPSTDSAPSTAILRAWKPGDRVRLRYSSSPRKVKEVLERMKVTGSDRISWPVLESGGRIVWMRGVELEPESGLTIVALPLVAAHLEAEAAPPAIPN
jgi:tRNA(Ile)-lysidine synthase